MTGRAGEPRISDADGSHGGAEFVLTVGSDRFQVQFDGRAREVSVGTRVTVIGRLAVIGDYEWDAFGLSESRADWLVTGVASADRGDTMLDLAPTSYG